MKKFIPWRKASTILLVLAVLSAGPLVYRHVSSVQRETRSLKDERTSFAAAGVTPDLTTEQRLNDSLNYGVVVDCGSSGSRVFVYCWEPHNGLANHLLNIKILRNSTNHAVVSKIKPGLSSFRRQPSEASNYLAPLLDFAVENVPRHKVRETPLFVFATAGLRLLPLEEQTALLADLQTDIGLDYDFIFSKSHIEVISGEDEAIYAWTAINHALGKFGHELNDDPLIPVEVSGKIQVRKKTVGMLDLGGASLQMALELPQTYSVYDPRVKENLFEFNLGCSSDEFSHKYKVYAKTFLGHGSDRTRSKYVEWIVGSRLNVSSLKPGDLASITDPCLSISSSEIQIFAGVTFRITGSGDLDNCRKSLRKFLAKSEDCLVSDSKRCSIDGAVLPDMNFRNVEFYGFSEFYYSMEDVLGIGGAYSYHYFREKAQDYCSTNWTTIEAWKNTTRFPRADAERYRLQCFKSAWVLEVLHSGLNFPTSYRHLTSLQHLDGHEIHWSLGSIIHKTKYFPLRYIERLSTARSKTSPSFLHLLATPPWSAVVLVFLLFLFASSVLCIHLVRPSSSSSSRRGRQRCTSTCTDPEPILGEERSDQADHKLHILRTRSFAAFV